ncbi:stabilizer of axonemal microtubules 4 [Anas acuta]|uniref:stabilizer of axonemal microtubules 4 n=1 Tax=Anas acuta TaxID=28680 RepID=UPI0035C8B743
MPSTRPFVCPRAKLRSLPWGSPALGLGPFSAKPRAGDSGDLMDFYATTYAVAYGHPGFRPFLGHHVGAGFVSNTRSDAASLIRPRSVAGGPFWDTTTAEHFQPLLLPDGRSLLPRHVHQPGSGYGHEQPLPHLRAGAVSPPPASGEHGADPALSDVLQRTTIGAKEETGFTRATPLSGVILPAALGQPLGASTTTTHYLPPHSGTGGRALPVLAQGSDRGSGFSRETPLSVPVSPRCPPVLLVSRGLQAPRPAQARLRGQQSTGRMEPSGFITNNGWAATPPWTPCPPAPGECSRDGGRGYGAGGPSPDPSPLGFTAPPGPSRTARPWGGVQAPRHSGFGTNNLRTALGGGGGTGLTAPTP